MNKEISEKAHLRSNFREKEYLLEWGSNPQKYYIFRAEIDKFFVRFLVQMKISKFAFEKNWPLEFTALLYMIILVAINSQIENVNKQGANSIKVFASQIGVNF